MIQRALFCVLDPELELPPYPCEEATDTVVERGSAPTVSVSEASPADVHQGASAGPGGCQAFPQRAR